MLDVIKPIVGAFSMPLPLALMLVLVGGLLLLFRRRILGRSLMAFALALIFFASWPPGVSEILTFNVPGAEWWLACHQRPLAHAQVLSYLLPLSSLLAKGSDRVRSDPKVVRVFTAFGATSAQYTASTCQNGGQRLAAVRKTRHGQMGCSGLGGCAGIGDGLALPALGHRRN